MPYQNHLMICFKRVLSYQAFVSLHYFSRPLSIMWIQCSVFKPGLVVDSAQILNFDRVTRVNFNFFINQNNIVLVKKINGF